MSCRVLINLAGTLVEDRDFIYEKLRQILSAFAVSFYDHSVKIYIRFKKKHTLAQVNDLISQIWSGTDREITMNPVFPSLEMTARDPDSKIHNLTYNEIAFNYELNNWLKNTSEFSVTDNFVIKYSDRFSFLYAAFYAFKGVPSAI